MKVTVVDAMAEVQAMGKRDTVKNCSHLAHHFTNCVMQKYRDYDEIRLIFDRYDVPHSLKTASRAKRQGNQPVDPGQWKLLVIQSTVFFAPG